MPPTAASSNAPPPMSSSLVVSRLATAWPVVVSLMTDGRPSSSMVSVSPAASAARLKLRKVPLSPKSCSSPSTHSEPTTSTPLSGTMMAPAAVS